MEPVKASKRAAFEVVIPEPFDFLLTIGKPAGWYWCSPREVFEDGTLWGGLYMPEELGHVPVGVKLHCEDDVVRVEAYAAKKLTQPAVEYLKGEIEAGLGKDLDLAGFYKFARRDPVLKHTVKDLYGMRLGSFDDLFGRISLAILLQMAPWKRSQQMMDGLLTNWGTELHFDRKTVILWPRPEVIASVDEGKLRDLAKLGYRAKLLGAAARFMVDTPLSMRDLDKLPVEEAVARVRAVPGIGAYASGIVLRRATAPIDAWSVILMSELLLGKTPAKPRAEIESINKLVKERWGEWSWMAFAYILNDLANLSQVYNISRLH